MKTLQIKLLLTAITLFMFVARVTAQDKPDPTKGAKAITDLMKTQLNLTDAQYQPVYDVNLDFLSRARGVRQSEEGKITKVKAVKKLDKERDVKLKAILTAAQYKTFLEQKEENREKIKAYYHEKKEGQ